MSKSQENIKKNYENHQLQYERNTNLNEEKFLQILQEFHAKTEDRLFLDKIRYDHILPLIRKEDNWLAVGDHYGEEAAWLSKLCNEALAADINTAILEIAQQHKFIKEYSNQNVECMTFDDDAFDFVLCRESYHHFPRPYIAVYEMLRCAKKGVVMIEPVDPLIKMPFLLWLCNVIDTKRKPLRSYGIWKNRFSFETVGNYVYKVSQREFEKLSMGMGLPFIAFHYSNNTCTNFASDIRITKRKILMRNILCKLKIIPYQMLTTILFKEIPDEETKNQLKQLGYYCCELPPNPYL